MTEGDRLVDLVREGVDCVLRLGDLEDSAMVGRRVALLPEVTCAAPAYLERRGVPLAPEDLKTHRMVGFLQAGTGHPYPLELTIDGKPRQIAVSTDVTVNSAENTVAMGLLGLGQAAKAQRGDHEGRGECELLDHHDVCVSRRLTASRLRSGAWPRAGPAVGGRRAWGGTHRQTDSVATRSRCHRPPATA